MLVLSRRLKEKVLFPGINVSVQVVSVKGNVVRLGVEAPPEVTVLREELARQSAPAAAEAPRGLRPADQARLTDLARQIRDRLQTTAVNLNMVQMLLDAGLGDDAGNALSQVRHDFQLLRLGLDAELEKEPEKPAPKPKKALKALLVEDDQFQRELLAGVLRMGGVEVETAGDGCDALDHLRSHERPDVVLLDMGLPRCDGATVVRTVRKNPEYAGMRIFAVTGRASDEFDLGTGSAGVDRWFRKPLDPTCLLNDLVGRRVNDLCGV